MLYSLLDLLACPGCQQSLVAVVFEEKRLDTPMQVSPAKRANQAGALVGPFLQEKVHTPLGAMLESLACMPANDGRDKFIRVQEGLLACPHCSRWYPIRSSLPEILPDYLRDLEEDRGWLARYETCFAGESARLYAMLRDWQPASSAAESGAKHKKAEMGITKNNLREGFLAAGNFAPFYPLRPAFSLDLLLRYGTTVQKLGCGTNALVLDMGIGYGWTSEWLVRLGYRAVGIDITRDYLLAGLPRMGIYQPYLVVADIENLPFQQGIFDAVLSYDSFHHLPNRNRAMQQVDRVMKPGTLLAMVEPGKDHESHPQSQAVMDQYGILEVGLDKDDLISYIQNTSLGDVQHYRSDAHPHSMYTVKKAGKLVLDSISPGFLDALIEVKDHNLVSFQAPASADMDFTIHNIGDTVWLSSTPGEIGEIRLGAFLYDGDRNLLQAGYAEVSLLSPVAPGESASFSASIPLPPQPGNYILEFDMRAANGIWFREFYFRTIDWKFTVLPTPGELSQAVAAPVYPLRITPTNWQKSIRSSTPISPVPSEPASDLPAPAARQPTLTERARHALRTGGPTYFVKKTIGYFKKRFKT